MYFSKGGSACDMTCHLLLNALFQTTRNFCPTPTDWKIGHPTIHRLIDPTSKRKVIWGHFQDGDVPLVIWIIWNNQNYFRLFYLFLYFIIFYHFIIRLFCRFIIVLFYFIYCICIHFYGLELSLYVFFCFVFVFMCCLQKKKKILRLFAMATFECQCMNSLFHA